jgi:hypothetical protein
MEKQETGRLVWVCFEINKTYDQKIGKLKIVTTETIKSLRLNNATRKTKDKSS